MVLKSFSRSMHYAKFRATVLERKKRVLNSNCVIEAFYASCTVRTVRKTIEH